MSYNHIVKKKTLGSVISGGKRLVLSAATETDHWTRPNFMPNKLKLPWRKRLKAPLRRFHRGQMKSVLGVWCTDKHHLTETDKQYRESNHGKRERPRDAYHRGCLRQVGDQSPKYSLTAAEE